MSESSPFLQKFRAGDKVRALIASLEAERPGAAEEVFYGRRLLGFRRAVLRGDKHTVHELVHYIGPGFEEAFYVSFPGTADVCLVSFGDGDEPRKWDPKLFDQEALADPAFNSSAEGFIFLDDDTFWRNKEKDITEDVAYWREHCDSQVEDWTVYVDWKSLSQDGYSTVFYDGASHRFSKHGPID